MGLYLVKPGGTKISGASTDGDWSDSNCYGSPATLGALNPAGGSHLILIHGTFASYILFQSTNWAGSVMFGVSSAGVAGGVGAANYLLVPGEIGDTLFNDPANTHFTVDCNNFTLKNVFSRGITTSGKRSFQIGAGNSPTGFTGENLGSEDCTGGAAYLFAGATGFNLLNSRIKGNNAANSNAISASGTSAGIIAKLLATGSISNPSAHSDYNLFNNSGSGTISIVNSILKDCNGILARNTGTGTTNIRNNVMASWAPGSYLLERTNGVLNYGSNLISPAYANFWTTNGTVVDEGGNKLSSNPKFNRRRKEGVIVFAVDDCNNVEYAQDVETVLQEKGVRATFLIDTYQAPANLAALQSVYANNLFEFVVHSYSHSNLSLTGNTYSITKAGATINIDRTANQIVINPGGSIVSFRDKTLLTIKSELEALGCTIGALPTNLKADTFGEILADSAGSQASPYTPQILIDTSGESGYYKTEIKDPKTYMESTFAGYVGKSFGTPFGASSANVQAAVKNLGFDSLRSAKTQGDAEWALASLDLYQLSYVATNLITDNATANEATVKGRIYTVCEYLASYGGIFFLLAHNTVGSEQPEATPEQWGWMIEAIQEYEEIQILTQSEASDYIRGSGLWSTSDNSTYTRTFSDQSDYHLQSTSQCIDAGVDVSLSTDFEGNPIYKQPDIGAYEYQYTTGFADIEFPGPLGIDATVTAGTAYPAVTIQAPLGAEFQAIPEFTGEVVVDLATLAPTAKIRTGPRGTLVYSADLDAAGIARADKVVGA